MKLKAEHRKPDLPLDASHENLLQIDCSAILSLASVKVKAKPYFAMLRSSETLRSPMQEYF